MRPPALLAPLLVVAGVLLTTMSPASAQPGVVAPLAPPSSVDGPPPPLAPLPKVRSGAHRPAVAFFLSFGSSVGLMVATQKGAFGSHPGVALGLFVVAPSTGRWYIGQVGVIGMAMRLGGLGLFASGIGNDEPAPIIAGATLMLTGVLYDMIGSGISADRQNRRRWAAMPAAIATPNGSLAPGVGISASF